MPVQDYIVTTPKGEMHHAAQEAADCLRAGGGYYFRRFAVRPRGLAKGSRIFYVEDGFVRGFAIVCEVRDCKMHCDTTGRDWPPGTYAVMDATTWTWIEPIPMRGFTGWRECTPAVGTLRIVGGWRDPKPEPQAAGVSR